ncbi:hypothetical protein [Maritalea mediterranea]|uniref:Uncharacterized protein n=1 Tax=Maritalea mediterranea TaxID=2909667 RepID=A0ABS9E4J5_9HYPH|nr:hypothetical protein [Maritalea mediterranea]MCF4097117.1 hypothetical protein [Maritalea mediterranea]
MSKVDVTKQANERRLKDDKKSNEQREVNRNNPNTSSKGPERKKSA